MSDGETVLVLRVEPPVGASFQQRVEGEEAIVGRSSKADITVPDRYLSRQQARFFRREGRWLVEDLGGRNPTVLNGKTVAGATPIAAGDLLVMSGARISVERVERPGDVAAAVVDHSADTSDSLFRPASGFIDSRGDSSSDAGGEELRRQAVRLRRLNEFSRALAAPIRLEELLELVLDRAFADLQPEEAVVFLRRPDGEFERAAVRRLPGVPDDFLYSRSLVREVTDKELAALVNDASADERFAAAESIQASGIRSLLAAPLLDPEGCPGMIVLNSRARRRRFSEVDMEELVALAAAAALRIRNIALTEEAAQRRVLEKELSLARQIQMALLPAALPRVDGYELEANNVPNREVSGDLYQVKLRGGDDECVLLLADVAGKGMSASLLTASLEALAAGPIEEGLPPEEVFSRLSRRLHDRTTPERYATGFIASLNPSSGRLRWASAGHNPVLLLRAGGELEQLDATGLPLGLLPLSAYTGEDRILDPGDLLVVYTDGITEAANPGGEEYGVERLVELCRRESERGLAALVEKLVEELDSFVAGTPYPDDRTFLMLRRLPE